MLDQKGVAVRSPLRRERGLAALLTAVCLSLVGAAPASPPSIRGELDAPGLRALLAKERGRTVLVNFWATWCVPCREEFPDLDRLARELAPRGLTVIGISTDFSSQTAAAENFLTATRPSFANYRKKSGGDDQAFIEAVDSKWGGELPFSVLYGPDGRKAKTLSGQHTYASYRREILDVMTGAGSRETGNGKR